MTCITTETYLSVIYVTFYNNGFLTTVYRRLLFLRRSTERTLRRVKYYLCRKCTSIGLSIPLHVELEYRVWVGKCLFRHWSCFWDLFQTRVVWHSQVEVPPDNTTWYLHRWWTKTRTRECVYSSISEGGGREKKRREEPLKMDRMKHFQNSQKFPV